MNTKAVVFDKDGTLIKFDPFWVPVTEKVIDDILKKFSEYGPERDEFFRALGISGGNANTNELLSAGTYEQMGIAIHDILASHGADASAENITDMIIDAFDKYAEYGTVLPTCANLAEHLMDIKNCGIQLLLVTTDNRKITDICLSRLGIDTLFDRIYTDDGQFPPKPNNMCIMNYSEESGIAAKDMIMVGDTMTDVRFAKNCGMKSIGVGETDEKRKSLAPHADFVVSDVSQVLNIIRGLG